MSYFHLKKDTKVELLEEGKCSRRITGYDGKLMTVEVIFENGYISASHKHPHEQITYCLEGKFEFYIGDETKKIEEGDTVYMPSDIMHNCKLLSDRGRLLDIFTPIREDFLS